MLWKLSENTAFSLNFSGSSVCRKNERKTRRKLTQRLQRDFFVLRLCHWCFFLEWPNLSVRIFTVLVLWAPICLIKETRLQNCPKQTSYDQVHTACDQIKFFPKHQVLKDTGIQGTLMGILRVILNSHLLRRPFPLIHKHEDTKSADELSRKAICAILLADGYDSNCRMIGHSHLLDLFFATGCNWCLPTLHQLCWEHSLRGLMTQKMGFGVRKDANCLTLAL